MLSRLTRRDFTRSCLALVGGAALGRSGSAETRIQSGTLLGRIRPRPSRAIGASSLSIGFETLDRRMFDPQRTYPHLAELGVKWARVQTGWARCETAKGQFDFTWLDEIVDSLLRIGIQPWFNVGYGNRLYTPAAPDVTAVGWTPMGTEEGRQAWRRFVGALAGHFGRRVRHYEIWNEPTEGWFWRPGKPSPTDYVQLVRLSAPEIRTRVPQSVIVGGALSGMPTEFLTRCLELGIADCADRISYHPYQVVPEKGYAEKVTAWRQLLARYKPSLGLWQGECGCPSQEGSVGALGTAHWNETRQAKWLLRRVLIDLGLKLELTSYYNVVDQLRYNWAGGPEASMSEKARQKGFGAYFGVLRGTDYSRKPSFTAYQTLCALFDVRTEQVEMPVDFHVPQAPGELVAADKICHATFARNGRPLCAYWWPADVQRDFALRPVDVTLDTGRLGLVQPVLVDLLTGEVRRVDGTQKAGRWTWPALPLTDHPMLVTDASVAVM
jgi:hypothetical protein